MDDSKGRVKVTYTNNGRRQYLEVYSDYTDEI